MSLMLTVPGHVTVHCDSGGSKGTAPPSRDSGIQVRLLRGSPTRGSSLEPWAYGMGERGRRHSGSSLSRSGAGPSHFCLYSIG